MIMKTLNHGVRPFAKAPRPDGLRAPRTRLPGTWAMVLNFNPAAAVK